MGKFVELLLLITFAYTMVKFYDNSISGRRLFVEWIHQRRRTVPCVGHWN